MTKPLTIVADGPIEICLGQSQVWISSTSGPLVHITNATFVVFHYLDHGETQIFGELHPEQRH